MQTEYNGRTLRVTMITKTIYQVSVPHVGGMTVFEGEWPQVMADAKGFVDSLTSPMKPLLEEGPYLPANKEEACLLAVQAKLQEAHDLFAKFGHVDPYLQDQLIEMQISISEMLAEIGSEAVQMVTQKFQYLPKEEN